MVHHQVTIKATFNPLLPLTRISPQFQESKENRRRSNHQNHHQNNTSVQVKSEEAELPQFENYRQSRIKVGFNKNCLCLTASHQNRSPIEGYCRDCKHIRDESGFDHAESVSATDYPKTVTSKSSTIWVPIQGRISHIIFSLSTRTDRNNARLPSLIGSFQECRIPRTRIL